jgi:hypothetical protein
MKKIIEKKGFYLIETHNIKLTKNTKITNLLGDFEPILVFKRN